MKLIALIALFMTFGGGKRFVNPTFQKDFRATEQKNINAQTAEKKLEEATLQMASRTNMKEAGSPDLDVQPNKDLKAPPGEEDFQTGMEKIRQAAEQRTTVRGTTKNLEKPVETCAVSTRNMFGITDYQAVTFQLLDSYPVTLFQGDMLDQNSLEPTEDGSRTDIQADTLFFFSQSKDCSRKSSPSDNQLLVNGGNFFKKIEDQVMIFNDPSVVEDLQDSILTYDVYRDGGYKQVFIHNAMGRRDKW